MIFTTLTMQKLKKDNKKQEKIWYAKLNPKDTLSFAYLKAIFTLLQQVKSVEDIETLLPWNIQFFEL